MEKIRILAPAKINLFLEVTGKRTDGYHNLCSLVEKVNLTDEVEICLDEKHRVEFSGIWQIPKENTVTKTVHELSMLFPDIVKKNPVKIVIKKCIPPGSGLGGASSDAAAVLKGCNELWKLGLDQDKLIKIGSKIGSDVPLFLKEGPCIIEGRGEIVHTTGMLPSLFFHLFVPEFQVSTKLIYDNLSSDLLTDLTSARSRIKIFVSLWKENNKKQMEKFLFNKLEEVTRRIYPEIDRAIRRLEALSGKRFVLTGSGGGIYALGKMDQLLLDRIPEIIRHWRYYKLESFCTCLQKEEQHGNY
ncbi:MAG TPA: 4-(cytidine 5'-diphospho)-2-C-methyl-D-erythritol kinase [bacterium]|nr:4-(cytidine 5'-diphospho)-2-C-methyl-D-erythritol kinase [bacterium]HOL49412.1 4-(cytidine 5'-diphospho)-2-C-methyl-D-erythritol kinase [bacterium]HPO52071.1 4-(cytidine 5'-diphospho)-2-C-methyl-D-erythritol kinase [bacterium]